MAKVAVITDQLSPNVELLARVLSHQQQELCLFTSQDQPLDRFAQFDVRTPFSKWSALEAARLLPHLLSDKFDVWHFVFSAKTSQPRWAHWILASMARTLPKTIVVGSFSHPKNLNVLNQRFVKQLDLALFPSRSMLMRTKRSIDLPERLLTEVLPPLESQEEKSELEMDFSAERLVKSLGPYLVLPDLQNPPKWIAKSPYPFIVLRSKPRRWGAQLSNCFFTGEISAAQKNQLLRSAKALCLLYSDYSVLELQKFHHWSERHRLPVLASEIQIELWPGLCWPEKSGWVLKESEQALFQLFLENPGLDLKQDFQTFPQRDLIDSSMNRLVRLYQECFQMRWT